MAENANKPPEENNIVIVTGKKKDEVVFADKIALLYDRYLKKQEPIEYI